MEFGPSFGSLRRTEAATPEAVAVPRARPETVPQPGVAATARPLDAYWASFGSAAERAAARAAVQLPDVSSTRRVLEVIIGTDDRTRVNATDQYPWRCICSLLITAQNGSSWIGTGWLVSPRVLLTAGHCVYMVDEGGWASQIEVIPGRNADARPFGSVVARDLRSVTGWTQDNDSDYDYGAILLPENHRLGDRLGWFGFANRSDDYLRTRTLNLAGYPGDGGPTGIPGTQWFHKRGVGDLHDRQITYEIDTVGGQSGAPVWELTTDGARYGVAIHTWGTSTANGGTRINSEVFDRIVQWAGQAP
jgi:V8-like Glu-specific endopeptidase